MASFPITRRTTLAGLGGAAVSGLIGTPAWAQSKTITVMANEAHKSAATVGKGGDLTANWRQKNDTKVDWILLDVSAITDRFLRESSLSSTAIDIGYIVYQTPQILSLMEPIKPFLDADPIPDADAKLSDFPPGLLNDLMVQGQLRGMPIRVTVSGLIYNEQILNERGITKLPTTLEELIEACYKCTYTRSDGVKVYGLTLGSRQYLTSGYSNFARSYNGDFILPDSTIVAGEKENLQSLAMLTKLYKDGVLQPEALTGSFEEIFNAVGQGRAAFYSNSISNVTRLNNPQFSKLAGNFKILDWPMTEALTGKVPYAPLVVSWSIVMPKSASPDRKKLAWNFVRELMTYEATVGQALNGNGPYRISAAGDQRIQSLTYMDFHAKGLKYGRPHVPAVNAAVKINDVFVEAAVAAVLGLQPAKQAMDEAAATVKKLL